MPVRSSLCTYSPSSTGTSSTPGSTNKYSSILSTNSSLSYGQYKPLTPSATLNSARGSLRSVPNSKYESSTTLSSPTSSTIGARNSLSRYSFSSNSSYSPTNSSANYSSNLANNSSSLSGHYKPLESPSVSRYRNNLQAPIQSRYSGSNNNLSVLDNHRYSSATSYKSPSSNSNSSAYSSGSSLSSSTSNNIDYVSSKYVPRSRRLSYTVS